MEQAMEARTCTGRCGLGAPSEKLFSLSSTFETARNGTDRNDECYSALRYSSVKYQNARTPADLSTYTETYTRGEAGPRPYGPDGGGVATLEAVEGGHRAKGVQAAPGVPADHRGGQALGPVLYERPAGALLKGGLPAGIRRAIDTLGPGLEPSVGGAPWRGVRARRWSP